MLYVHKCRCNDLHPCELTNFGTLILIIPFSINCHNFDTYEDVNQDVHFMCTSSLILNITRPTAITKS